MIAFVVSVFILIPHLENHIVCWFMCLCIVSVMLCSIEIWVIPDFIRKLFLSMPPYLTLNCVMKECIKCIYESGILAVIIF